MAGKKVKSKGKTHAIVGTERAVAHLDPTSTTHAVDQRRAQEARQRVAGVIIVDDTPRESLKFPSLAGGVMIGADGRELTSSQHSQLLNRLRVERGSYKMTQKRADGREYVRKRKTDGVRQLAISLRPEHALAFARLDQNGVSVRKPILSYAQKLAHEFHRLTGYEVVASQIHPEESSLHLHITYATVNAEGELLHSNSSVGRKGLRLAGPSIIGTLRLVDAGIWPEADAKLARRWLSERREDGELPVDYSLSQFLDGLAEKSLTGLGKQGGAVKKLIDSAYTDYEADARARRETRPDVLAQKVEDLTLQNSQLQRENAALRSENEALKSAGPSGNFPRIGRRGIDLGDL